MMPAAGRFFITADDVTDGGELRGVIAHVLAEDGTGFLDDVVANLPVLDRTGSLPATVSNTPGPDWLAFCRRRPGRAESGSP
jgi:hypothetical protein